MNEKLLEIISLTDYLDAAEMRILARTIEQLAEIKESKEPMPF